MVEHFAKTEDLFKLLLKKWNALREMESILHVPYLTTVMLQKDEFTLSDFFGCLQIMNMKINQIVNSPSKKYTNLAVKLQQTLSARKSKMLDNQLMLCALYLDPRYKCEIDKDQDKVQLVKFTLENIWERVKIVKGDIIADCGIENGTPNTTSESLDSIYDELDQQYNSMGMRCVDANDNFHGLDLTQDRSQIAVAIEKYHRSVTVRMKSSESVLEFWEKNKEEFGLELYELASIIFAVPPTQSSVERCFSALKFMLTDRRYNLNPELLEAMLLIHLNRCEYYFLKEEEIKQLESTIRDILQT